MAQFHPSSLDAVVAPPAHQRVYGALRRALAGEPASRDSVGESALCHSVSVWYRPVIRSSSGAVIEPDFLVVGSFGIAVLSVWAVTDDIVGGGAKQLRTADKTGRETRRPHPLHKARQDAEALSDLLLAHGRGLDRLPVVGVGVFPEFRRDALKKLGVAADPAATLSADWLLADQSAEAWLEKLAAFFEDRAVVSLDESMLHELRSLVQPQIHFFDHRELERKPSTLDEVVLAETHALRAEADARRSEIVDVPPSGLEQNAPPSGTEESALSSVRAVDPVDLPLGFFLDRKQERMARTLASPRTLIYGPAGSGKTVFLVSRARYWRDLKPDAKILFTCYNSSLASHLRNEFELRGMTPDEDALSVIHYHDLCRRTLGMGADFHEKPADFYAVLEPKVLQAMAQDEDLPTYDLVLVDEGQDFTRRMIEVLVRFLKPGGELTMVCDPAQDLYERWQENNLDPLGDHAIERLVDCYRNTAPIYALALAVLSAETRKIMGLDRLEMTRPEDLGRDGPPPRLENVKDLNALLDVIESEAKHLRSLGKDLSDMAVLYPHRAAIPNLNEDGEPEDLLRGNLPEESYGVNMGTLDSDDDGVVTAKAKPHFAEVLENELRDRGIPCDWVARDFATKSAYDISKPRLTLSTIHSAKGMDYHTVILLGVEALKKPDPHFDPGASSLLFTAVTRARERLVMPYFEENGWVGTISAMVEPELKA